jgi:hypothetical protein
MLLSSPEPIYVAPSFKQYTTASYTLSTFFMAYGGYALQLWIIPPEGIALYVTMCYGVASVVLFLVGCWTLSATTKLVRGITAVPHKEPGGSLHVKLEVSRFVPWMTSTMEVPLTDIYLDKSILDQLRYAGASSQREPLSTISILLRPWVWMGRGLADFGLQTRSMFLREHMVKMMVRGQGGWKFDVRGQALGGHEGTFYYSAIFHGFTADPFAYRDGSAVHDYALRQGFIDTGTGARRLENGGDPGRLESSLYVYMYYNNLHFLMREIWSVYTL